MFRIKKFVVKYWKAYFRNQFNLIRTGQLLYHMPNLCINKIKTTKKKQYM